MGVETGVRRVEGIIEFFTPSPLPAIERG